MLSSPKYSYLLLRLGLAAVFLWFGVDKLLHPTYWLTVWTSPRLTSLIGTFGISESQLIYAGGLMEVLIGLSMVSSILAKTFSLFAILYLSVILILNGLTEITVRDLGLVGGLFAILFWPNFRNRF